MEYHYKVLQIYQLDETDVYSFGFPLQRLQVHGLPSELEVLTLANSLILGVIPESAAGDFMEKQAWYKKWPSSNRHSINWHSETRVIVRCEKPKPAQCPHCIKF